MLGSKVCGGFSSNRTFVKGGVINADGEGLQVMMAQLAGKGDESCGVDPSREKDTDGHVTDEVCPHGIKECVPGELDSIGIDCGLRTVGLPVLVGFGVAIGPSD